MMEYPPVIRRSPPSPWQYIGLIWTLAWIGVTEYRWSTLPVFLKEIRESVDSMLLLFVALWVSYLCMIIVFAYFRSGRAVAFGTLLITSWMVWYTIQHQHIPTFGLRLLVLAYLVFMIGAFVAFARSLERATRDPDLKPESGAGDSDKGEG